MPSPRYHRAARWGLIAGIVLATTAASAQPAAVLERGRVLVEGVGACGNCHLARGPQRQPLPERGLSGGFVFDEPPYRAVASNITPDAATGIGRWTDAQIGQAIREGIRPDGSVIGPPMPVANYRSLSDADLAAVVAYLRAQPAVSNTVEKSVYRVALPTSYGPPLGGVLAPVRSDQVGTGRYLVQLGHCMNCHTPGTGDGQDDHARLGAGGKVFTGPWGVSVSRNLTPHESGLQAWSDTEIARAVREGIRRDGSRMKPPMGYAWYRRIDDADMAAVISYLRSLDPVPFVPLASRP